MNKSMEKTNPVDRTGVQGIYGTESNPGELCNLCIDFAQQRGGEGAFRETSGASNLSMACGDHHFAEAALYLAERKGKIAFEKD